MLCIPTCENCQRNYQLRDCQPVGRRIPLLLPCGHTFCEGCLVKVAKDKNEVSCFSCGFVVHLPGTGKVGVRTLLPNIYLLGLLLYYKRVASCGIDEGPVKTFNGEATMFYEQGSYSTSRDFSCSGDAELASNETKLCEECNSSTATCLCPNCESSRFCEDCFTKVHSVSKLLMKHLAQPIVLSIEKELVCSAHDERKLEFYDKDTGDAVCAICIISEKCRGHDVILLSEFTSDSEHELLAAVEKAKETLFWLDYSSKEMLKELPNECVEANYLFSDAHASFNACHTLLQKRHSELMQVAAEKLAKCSIQQTLNHFKHKKLSLDQLLKNIERAQGDKGVMFLKSDEYLGKLKEYLDSECIAIRNPTAEDDYTRLTITDEVVNTVEKMGSINEKKDKCFVYQKVSEVSDESKEELRSNFEAESSDALLDCNVKNETTVDQNEGFLLENDNGELSGLGFVKHENLSCSLCEKTYSWKHDLNCDRTYASKADLECHIRSAHGSSVQLHCSFCGITYSRNDQLERHMQIAHNSDVGVPDAVKVDESEHGADHGFDFRCVRDISSSTNVDNFDQQSNASTVDYKLNDTNSHPSGAVDSAAGTLTRQVKNPPPKFYCSLCEMSFTDEHGLLRHINEHKSNSFLECSLCSKIYASIANLKKHLRYEHKSERKSKKHKSTTDDISAANGTKTLNKLPTSTEEENYQCKICTKVFSSKTTLNGHYSVHSRAKNRFAKRFACHACEKIFRTGGGLAIHVACYHRKSKRFCVVSGKPSNHREISMSLANKGVLGQRFLGQNLSPHRKLLGRRRMGGLEAAKLKKRKLDYSNSASDVPIKDVSSVTKVDATKKCVKILPCKVVLKSHSKEDDVKEGCKDGGTEHVPVIRNIAENIKLKSISGPDKPTMVQKMKMQLMSKVLVTRSHAARAQRILRSSGKSGK